LERRLSKWCETNGIFEQEQAGFRPGRTTVHQIFTLAEIIKKRKKKRQATYCCFLDIRKAYDTVWREGLWKKLEAIGVDEKLMKVIKNTYVDVKSRVIVNDRLSDWFDIGIGLRQGCVLSPLLFLIFINDLIRELNDSNLGVAIGNGKLSNLTFADDIALVANNSRDLQALVRIAESYARKWNFAFNTKKCKVLVFNRKGAQSTIILDNDSLEVVREYKYLGVWLDDKLNWKTHKTYILAKAKKRAYTIFGFGINKLLPVKTCVNLWEVLVRPILEYAGEVWGEGPWEEADKLQREVAKTILNAPTRTANEAVLGDLGWWELKARRDKARLKLLRKLMDYEEGGHIRNLLSDDDGDWLRYTDNVLNRLDINREVARYLDEKQGRGLVTNRTQAAEEKRWRDVMGRKSKLRTYRTVKDKLVFEPYLNFDSRRTRILLTRLRSGTNFLRIEKGRYENEAVEDRVCYWCDKVEDERHFLMECDL